MPDTQDTQKTLEVKIRPYSSQNNQERPDQKGVSRVHICREALLDLKLESGQPCYLWKIGENEDGKREAIAWLTAEKSLSKKVVQISKTFQEACGFKLGDDLNIKAAKTLSIAESIVLKDVTTQDVEAAPELGEEDRPHWEWYLRESLARAEVVFPGMSFKNISLRGPRRTFLICSVNGSSISQGRYDEATSAVAVSNQAEAAATPHTNGPQPRLEVANIAGIDQALSKLNRFLSNFDREFNFTWAQRSCAVLVHGSRGTGKTFILNKIISTGWAKRIIHIESDARPVTILTAFKDAKASQPSIIVLDELELLVGKEDTAAQNITKALGDELDTLIQSQMGNTLPKVLVIAATLNPSAIPISLKKRGRFRTEIALPIPDAPARRAILKSLAPPLHPSEIDTVLSKLGDKTHAYTAEDLVSLLDTACDLAEEELSSTPEIPAPEEQPQFFLSQAHIDTALALIRPTAMHDITLSPPPIRWHEIGGQSHIKSALRRAVETPLLHPARIKRLGLTPKKGLLLYGPPGCSKTLSAQAMATEIGFNFFAVKGAELLNMYVGESERAVREIFARARAASPSIIFFDEIESIGAKRSASGRNTGVNVLTTLLNEMDGIESLLGVLVLAATNQPQSLDLALLRPGRFDKLLYVAPPDLVGRIEILQNKKKTMDFDDDVDIEELAKMTEGYSGAELVGICMAAADEAVEKCEETGQEERIGMSMFLRAMGNVKKQITPEMVKGYEDWAKGIKGGGD